MKNHFQYSKAKEEEEEQEKEEERARVNQVTMMITKMIIKKVK